METKDNFDDSWIDSTILDGADEEEEPEPRFVKIKPKLKLEDDKPKFRSRKSNRRKTIKNWG